jgi:Flp pilus assembly protein TadD
LAEAQLAQHQRAAGLRSLHRGLAKDPRDWVLWMDLAGATHGTEQLVAAKQALRLNPLSPELNAFLPAVVRP